MASCSRWGQLIPFRGDRKEAGSPSKKVESHLEACPQGLKVVTEGGSPVIDIVAIHGLNGHQYKTWTARNGKHWLRDFLPNDIPNARIFCWGYDANTHGDRVGCQYLYDHAKTLVSDLCLKRKITNTTKRPIIFVAHSLGGIIVKSALIHSEGARKGALEDHRSIKISTYGIFFMGTPHQGGSAVQLGKLLVNVASVFVAADDRLLKHLDQGSEWLHVQLGQYGPISGDFVTKFAYEEYKTPTLLGHSIMVVPRASAVVPGAADAEPIVIHADHINMTKFASEEDDGYKTVSGHLQIMAQNSSNIIASRWEEESRVNAARINSEESFSIVFSLSGVPLIEYFVARQEELAEMHKILGAHDTRRTVVLHGLGGIGKTQVGVAYAKLHRADYSAIFWLNIKDEDSLKQSFERVAKRILRMHPSDSRLSAVTEDSNLDDVVEAVNQWLVRPKNTRWLMVFDNYDNPKFPGNPDHGAMDIDLFLPDADHGSIIVTTRSSQVDIGHRVRLGKLKDVCDSLQILSNVSQRKGVIYDPNAKELAKKLDGLPLALATAGSYLFQVSTSFAEYLSLYNKSWLKLHQESPGLGSYEDRALYSTWQLSFDSIKRQNELSAKLLQLWGYFDNQDLWFELLREGSSDGPEWLSQLTEDPIIFTRAVRVLCDHGLVEVDETSAESGFGSRGYSIHNCVHSWIIHTLKQEWDAGTASLALECAGSHVPVSNARHLAYNLVYRIFPVVVETKTDLQLAKRLLPHAHALFDKEKGGSFPLPNKDQKTLASRLAFYLRVQGSFESALRYAKIAVEQEESVFGPADTRVLSALNDIAVIHRHRGELDIAQNMSEVVLEARERILGPEHPDTLESLHNHATILYLMGEYIKAEEVGIRVLALRARVLGDDHPDTLKTLSNLGITLQKEGKYPEAEKAFRKVVDASKLSLGRFHINTLTSMSNLGTVFQWRKQWDDAFDVYTQVFEGNVEVRGPHHHETLKSKANIATVLEGQGRHEDAEALLKELVVLISSVLGGDHPEALTMKSNLAITIHSQGRYQDAERCYREVFEARKLKLGPKHLDTIESGKRADGLAEWLQEYYGDS